MKLLITGASGYLGSRLLKGLNKKKFLVYPIRQNTKDGIQGYDLTCIDSVASLVKEFNPECIIHCAGYVPTDTSGYLDSNKNMLNELMTNNLLNLTSCPIIYISSMTVYGAHYQYSIKENLECFPETAYANSKLNGERLIEKDGRGGFAVRIPGLFGLPRQSGLVHNLLLSAKHNKNFSFPKAPVLWSGMHVEHAAEAVLNLLPKLNDLFTPINIGYSGKLSIDTLVEAVNKLLNTNLKSGIEHPCFEFDLALYRKLTSSSPLTLTEGIDKVGVEIGQ